MLYAARLTLLPFSRYVGIDPNDVLADVRNSPFHRFALIECIGRKMRQPAFGALPRQHLALAFLFKETPQHIDAVGHRQNSFHVVIGQQQHVITS
jgi:hypothetical protein